LTPSVKVRVKPQSGILQDVVKAEGSTAPVTIALIEDDDRLREALHFQLTGAGFEVTAYTSAEELLKLAGAKEFDCVLADVFLPKMNGLQLQEELNRTIPYASIVFMTGHGELSLAMHAMRNGAVDFLEKPVDQETLLNSIARGADRSRVRHAEQAERIELEKLQGALTAREKEVFALITKGLLNKQVAAELGTTERTIKAHRASVMSKMSADSLADLVRMASTLGVHLGSKARQ
jgi:FixJ family two-component response regulator